MISDVKYACRQLIKSPGFAVVTILTLALGIGANTAIFSLLDGLVLRSLPVKNPQEIALLSPSPSTGGSAVGPHGMAYPLYRTIRDNNQVYDGLLCHFRLFANVGVRGETQRVTVELVSGNYFDVLGVRPALGRMLTSADDLNPGAHPVAVLSHDYWMNAFGGDAAVLGQTIRFNGQPLIVVGVSEERFTGVDLDFRPQIRVPMAMTATLFPSMNWVGLESTTRWVEIFGRLKPGVSLAQAQAAIQPQFRAWIQSALDAGAYGQPSAADKERFLQSTLFALSGAGGTSFIRREWSTPLRALTAMGALLLLLTCANIASLFIGRGVARGGEIALRLALGAGRSRIVRQLFAESLLVVVPGGAAGIWLAPLASGFFVRFLPATTEGTPNISVDLNARILAVSIAVTAAAAILAGLLPALWSTRSGFAAVLKRSTSHVLPKGRFRQLLVVAQVCLSMVLLFGSGLFARSLHNLYRVAPGFDTGSLVTFGTDAVLNGYPRERAEDVYLRVKERLETSPQIESATFGLVRLLGGTDVWKTGTAIEGLPPPSGDDVLVSENAVSPDYFRTLRIGFLQGRDFAATDRADSPPVVIVNKTFVRRFLGDVAPLGRRAWLFGPSGPRLTEIVGVVEDSHYETVRGPSPAQIFVPYPQFFTVTGMNGYVRSKLPVEQVASLIRDAVREIDPALPVHALRTMAGQRDRSLGTERVIALLATAFGVLATSLTGIGLFGVLNYTVARRTRELGLRMALGAPAGRVASFVLKEVAILCGAGVVLAIPLILVLSRLVASQLHGVATADPWTAAGVTLLLAIVAMMAAAIPTRRATKVDPMVAMRAE